MHANYQLVSLFADNNFTQFIKKTYLCYQLLSHICPQTRHHYINMNVAIQLTNYANFVLWTHCPLKD